MQTGRELDAWIAEQVMGLHVGHWGEKNTPEFEGMVAWPAKDSPLLGQFELPHYSTRIEDAWQVVEKMLSNNYMDLEFVGWDGWQCSFYYIDDAWSATAATAPLAICLAALKAVE